MTRINCDSHSSLWSKTTAFEKSQRGYLVPEAATVSCGQMPNYVSYKKICIFKRRVIITVRWGGGAALHMKLYIRGT